MIRVTYRAGAVTYRVRAASVIDSGADVPSGPVVATLHDGTGTQTASGTSAVSGGAVVWDIPAEGMPRLDSYQVQWSTPDATWTTDIELVGGHLFTVGQMRKPPSGLADPVKFPDDLCEDVRVSVEDTIEQASNVAWVPRGGRCLLVLDPRPGGPVSTPRIGWLTLPHYMVREVYSVTVGGVPLTADELASLTICDDTLIRSTPWPTGTPIAVHYVHGFGRPPAPISRAALRLVRDVAIDTGLPSRATATSIGDQMYRLTIAGRDGVTGLPEVDAAIAQFGRHRFGLGLA